MPVGSLHLISRYVGGSDETAPLHKLGNESWAKTRQKAAEKNSVMWQLNYLMYMPNEK